MSKKVLPLVMVLIPVLVIVGLVLFAASGEVAVLGSSGEIARRQRDVLVFAFLLGMLVIIPVFILTLFISIRYRAGNKKSVYKPSWGHNNTLEAIWWGIPILIIMVLCVVTWRTSHTLDPYKPLDAEAEPVEIQVIAMDWKWLFLYTNENIATVNLLEVPVDRPLNFKITSDAPMNSFWIPDLGGQIYAMKGMQTKLHLKADRQGTYYGRSANISGEGFAHMDFEVRAVEEKDYQSWVDSIKASNPYLDDALYAELAKPSIVDEPLYYSSFKPTLYNELIDRWMPYEMHGSHAPKAQNTEGGHAH